MSGYSIVHVDDIPEQDDGRTPMRAVRHQLGITSFGVNAWVAKNAGDRMIPEHREADESEDDHHRARSADSLAANCVQGRQSMTSELPSL